MINYRATLDVPRELVWFVAKLLLAEAGAGARRLAGSGLHAGADTEDFRITGLAEVFGIYETAGQAIAAR